MAYMLSANMDLGAKDFQLEAAISKVYASVSVIFTACGTCYLNVMYDRQRGSPIVMGDR